LNTKKNVNLSIDIQLNTINEPGAKVSKKVGERSKTPMKHPMNQSFNVSVHHRGLRSGTPLNCNKSFILSTKPVLLHNLDEEVLRIKKLNHFNKQSLIMESMVQNNLINSNKSTSLHSPIIKNFRCTITTKRF